MDASQFAEFWRLQGHRVIRTASCYWYDPYKFSFLSMPYHRILSPSRGELPQVWLKGPSAVVRFPTAYDGTGRIGGLFICTNRNYDLMSLHKKARNQTRRGIENCVVEQVDFHTLADQGHRLNVETFIRQGRNSQTMSLEQWRRYCNAACQVPGFAAWGAFVQGQLAAFMVAALVEDCFSILHQSSANEYLDCYPNNSLVFTVTRLQMSSPDVKYVSYGLKSLDDTNGLDHFKSQMGFQLKLFKEQIEFNPLLKLFLVFGGHSLIKKMARQHPENDFFRKAYRTISVTLGEHDVA